MIPCRALARYAPCMRRNDGYVEVARFPDTFLANLWTGRLKAEGLDATVEPDLRMDEWAMAEQLMKIAVVRVFVAADDAAAAREILRGVDKAEVVD